MTEAPQAPEHVKDSSFAALSGRTGEIVGAQVIHYVLTGSTMDDTSRLASEGAPEGLVVLADSQAAGRGRHGRAWVSWPGEDLLLSVVFRPRPSYVHQLLMLAALAAADTAENVTGVHPSIKWPNDVRIGGRKLCGVIAETRQGTLLSGSVRPGEAAASSSDTLITVVGIGLNVNLDPPGAISSGKHEATSMATSLRAIAGGSVSRLATFTLLLKHMDRLYARLVRGDSLVPEWSSRLETIGSDVSVTVGSPPGPDRVVHGRAEGVDEVGRLLVRDSTGRLWPMSAGEVTLQSPL
ncbi:MAG: biotin--[acetyl-CoA-carboxylase] ligase [Dehalococcoidia bacterium]|nr:biotin--[acetyl-CoA-carboxylase] ligase [Dehalococcoidia bacterium]MSQ35137.1 biotin--[acetyl-CoA-carboxylase] ligase [Dehalococcoidia bacterium]